MSRTLILNESNFAEPNTLTYNFPQGQTTFKDGDTVAMSATSIYYSWFNVNSTNNVWSYTWVNGAVVDLTLPEGFYTAETMNAYLQNAMFNATHYLIDSTGQRVYYLEIVTNPTYYAVQINAYPLPGTLPTGWSLPPGITWSLGFTFTAQITIGSLGPLVGFNAGTYPPAAVLVPYSALSQNTPQITPISSVLMTCDLVQNPMAIPSSLLYSFSPNVQFGSMIRIEPNNPPANKIQPGQYSSISIRFFDQNMRPLRIRDRAIVVLLSINIA